MDTVEILEKLGFEEKLGMESLIKNTSELAELQKQSTQLDLSEPVENLNAYLTKWEALTSKTPEMHRVSLLGESYKLDGWTHGFLADLVEVAEQDIRKILHKQHIDSEGEGWLVNRNRAIESISELFKQMAIGHLLMKAYKTLKEAQPVVDRHPSYFSDSYITLRQLSWKVAWMNTIEQAGFSPEMSLDEMTEKKGLLAEMIDKFNTLKSPDRSKTIRERIKSIKNSSEVDSYTRSLDLDKDFFALGYQLAIRGEQYPIWHWIIKEEGKPEYSNKTTELRIKEFKPFIENLLQGYASCYFQSWLESELKKGNTHVQRPKQEIAPNKSADISLRPNLNTSLQIKWTGQRNQVYELFRQLKEIEKINNTNLELANIIKQTFDIFRDTKVSTIEKELGRKQELPKTRRINVIDMITEDTTS